MKVSVDQALRRAAALAGEGRVAEAAAVYRDLLQRFPGNRQAREALHDLARMRPDAVPGPDIGPIAAAYNQGRFRAALDGATALADRFPEAFAVHHIMGASQARLGHPEAALASYGNALQLRPDRAEIHAECGNMFDLLGRGAEALASYDQALRLKPDFALAHNNRGNVLARLKRMDDALSSYDAALFHQPAYADAHNNRANVLAGQRRLAEALASYDRALALRPNYAEAANNRGNVLREMHRTEEALAAYDTALGLRPDYAEAHNNRGNALIALKRPEAALASYDEALRLMPGSAITHNNRGIALAALGRFDEALADYDAALRLQPDYAVGYNNRGNVLVDQRRLDEALANARETVRRFPDFTQAIGQMRYLQAQVCDWTEPRLGALPPLEQGPGNGFPPFVMTVLDDDPGRQLACARTWATRNLSAIRPAPFAPAPRAERLRIGYFSADFHDHATMVLLGRVLECHDRQHFEIHAFSYGKAQDGVRDHVLRAVDQFHDIAAMDDDAIVALARREGIDLAVDLKGYTTHSRSDLFARRLAPVQIAYLGYPGTMGADFIDYIVADAVVLPPSARGFYTEKAIVLPGSYQANDDRRAISERRFARSELGLPEDGFVFCCFNHNYKITAAEFDIWMRLLGKVEGSVLWLLCDNPTAAANLRREAEARGMAADRLVFAERMPSSDHLARHGCADLFLDTFVCNAHTTASDALWAGLPLVTRLGRSFASRVAGSLLHAVGLPELVTETAAEYEALALALATDPGRLAAVRAKLAANRLTTPLFDTAGFTRGLERGYELAYQHFLSGAVPDHIEVG